MNHAEAFCLMKYASEDGRVVEWLWNSRDGVTPFCIRATDGKTELRHAQWRFDVRIPNYLPLAGERVFVDVTLEMARAYREKYVEEWWEKEVEGCGSMKASGQYASKRQAVERLAAADCSRFEGHAPWVITGEEYRAANAARYAAGGLD